MCESIDESLGELLRLADADSDNVSKNIISTYDPDVQHTVNTTKISSSRFKLVDLEQCASFLKIKLTKDPDNKKIFTNKASLADRIILKIESLFPQKCQDCEQKYCSSLNMKEEDQLFECFFCGQLSHNCPTLKRKYGLLIGSDLPAGSIWLCEGCHSKNNHLHKHTVSTTPIPNPNDNAPVVDPPQETSICKEYIHGKCKHGINGNKVFDGAKSKFLHPKRCIKFCKYGSSHRLGCNYGTACHWFHPILCRYSVQHGVCYNSECTYVHLANTSRKKVNRFQMSSYNSSYVHTQDRRVRPNRGRTLINTTSNHKAKNPWSIRNHQSQNCPVNHQNYYDRGSTERTDYDYEHGSYSPNQAIQEPRDYPGYRNGDQQLPLQRVTADYNPQTQHFLGMLEEFKTIAKEMKLIQEEWRQSKSTANATQIQPSNQMPTNDNYNVHPPAQPFQPSQLYPNLPWPSHNPQQLTNQNFAL